MSAEARCGRCTWPLGPESIAAGTDRCLDCRKREQAATERDMANLAAFEQAATAPHHGPPCGHTILGTCPGCGGHPLQYTFANTLKPDEVRINAAEQTFAMYRKGAVGAPSVTVTAEALAEAWRQVGALKRLREENDAAIERLRAKLSACPTPYAWLGPAPVQQQPVSPVGSAWGRDYPGPWAGPLTPGPDDARGQNARAGLKHGPGGRGGPGPCDPVCWKCASTPAPIDPFNVEYDGVRLRDLLVHDERTRREDSAWDEFAYGPLTPAQRAAVSAHWSAALRAKVAASAAADKARATSVVVDMEEP